MTRIVVQEVQDVQKVQGGQNVQGGQLRPIRPIRLIRGKKNNERKDALYAGCPCRAPDVWDAHTQGDAPLCPGLSACYPFQGAYLTGLTRGRVFILVYRLR